MHEGWSGGGNGGTEWKKGRQEDGRNNAFFCHPGCICISAVPR